MKRRDRNGEAGEEEDAWWWMAVSLLRTVRRQLEADRGEADEEKSSAARVCLIREKR